MRNRKTGSKECPIIHSRPVHTTNSSSPFSRESLDQNFRGFLHLALLLLVVNMLRLVLENIRKYGLLLSVPGATVPLTDILCGAGSFSVLFINITSAFLFEWALVSRPKLMKHRLFSGLIVANVCLLLAVPTWIVCTHMYHPLLGSMALCLTLILCMKIISYHVVNSELRLCWKSGNGSDPYPDCPYPQNITLRNVYYFWLAPTLCYQPSYPLIPHFRPKFLIKRLVELAASLAMIHILTDQYAIPTIKNSMKHIDQLDVVGMFERVLKLSISSLCIWLLGFYAFFHSFLNTMAEVLCFGDRMFYSSWWNANTFEEYWRCWNAPVHQWIKRHLYIPLRARGYPPLVAQTIIFLVSALAHEFLVAVPTQIYQGWAFIGMLLQVPLIGLTAWFAKLRPNSAAGNFFFWLCFCILGQPMVILLYYRAWINKFP